MTPLQLVCIIGAPIVVWLLAREVRAARQAKREREQLAQHIGEIIDRHGGGGRWKVKF